MYIGHGNGGKYINAKGMCIDGASGAQKKSTVLLMGCSSGKMSNYGEMDNSCLVLNYLISGRYV